MKNLLLLMFSVLTFSMKAQSEGQTSVSLGAGIIYLGFSVEAQKILKDNIGIGVSISISDLNDKIYSYSKDKNLRNPDYDLGVRGIYYLNEHLKLEEKLSVYVSAGGGLRLNKSYGLFDLYDLDPGLKFNTRLTGRIGALLNISEKSQFNFEIGKGPSWVSTGLKLNLSK